MCASENHVHEKFSLGNEDDRKRKSKVRVTTNY